MSSGVSLLSRNLYFLHQVGPIPHSIWKKSALGSDGPFITSSLNLFLTTRDCLLNMTIFFPISLLNTLVFRLAALSWLWSLAQFP